MDEPRTLPPERRARYALGLAFLALLLLLLALFRTQVVRGGGGAAADERVRAVPLPAARGAILDRHGEPLAESVPGYAVLLLPAPRDTLRAVLTALTEALALPPVADARIDSLLDGPPRPIVVARGLSMERVAAVEERRPALRHVLVEPWPTRSYALDGAAAPVVGRVGANPAREPADAAGVSRVQYVGLSGLEREHEQRLRGTAGLRYVRMDARGSVVSAGVERPVVPPRPGSDLATTLDRGLQRQLASLLSEAAGPSTAGALIQDIATGEVLALAATGDSASTDTAGAPNPVVGTRRPTATLFHPVTALLALEDGVDPQRPAAVPCRGGMRYGHRYFRCWNGGGHGALDLAGALEAGCDVYFYQAGLRLGLQALLDAGSRLGLHRRTGVGLPEERPGLFPPSAEWIREETGWSATPATALELAGGRGLDRQTLMRMVQVYAVLLSDSAAAGPVLVAGESRATEWSPDDRESRLRVREALRRVTAPGGAAAVTGDRGWWSAGQLVRWRSGTRRGTSWFVGAFGRSGPEIVVTVALDAAASQDAAARVAGAAADWYLRRRHGTPATGGP